MDNPNISNKKLSKSLVLYADILGFTDMVKESIKNNKGDEFLNTIRGSLDRAYLNIRNNNKSYSVNSKKFKMKSFTDNLVIVFPISNIELTGGESEFGKIVNMISEYQVGLAMDGFFIRGGLAIGMDYMDKDIVLGEGLISAYGLDIKDGPPRIVIDSELRKQIKKQFEYYANKIRITPHYNDILSDADGEIFINYLNEPFLIFPEVDILDDVLSKHKSMIEKNLDKFKNKSKIYMGSDLS